MIFYTSVFALSFSSAVEDLDAVEYSIQEEYVAQINFEVLGHLDPAIRSRINMNFLARFTNTEPALLAPYKNEMVGVIDSTSPKLSPLSTSDSVQSLHRCFSLILQKSHDTSCTNHSSYNHNWNNNFMKLKRSNTISGISSITMEESKCSISPVKFVVQCEGEQNEGAVKNLLKVVTGSWLVTSSLASMPDISNEMVRMKEKKSDGMEEDSEDIVYCVDGDNECAVGMEDRECALVMDREKYAVGVESGGYEEDQ